MTTNKITSQDVIQLILGLESKSLQEITELVQDAYPDKDIIGYDISGILAAMERSKHCEIKIYREKRPYKYQLISVKDEYLKHSNRNLHRARVKKEVRKREPFNDCERAYCSRVNLFDKYYKSIFI